MADIYECRVGEQCVRFTVTEGSVTFRIGPRGRELIATEGDGTFLVSEPLLSAPPHMHVSCPRCGFHGMFFPGPEDHPVICRESKLAVADDEACPMRIGPKKTIEEQRHDPQT